MTAVEEIYQAKESSKGSLLTMQNVVGVGVGYQNTGGKNTGNYAIVVMVSQKLPVPALPREAVLPKSVNGVLIDVIEVGELRAFQSRSNRWRPAPGGVSIGHYKVTAGTLGAVARDRNTGKRLILSNNHVIANSNDAAPGDQILQPGPIDGGSRDSDTIAFLDRFCPIQFTLEPSTCEIADTYAQLGNFLAALIGSKHRLQSQKFNPQAVNLVDAAVAKPVNDDDVLDEILEIGEINGIAEGSLGMSIRKSGRTTSFTTGQINLINATVDVSYGGGRTARFENQLVSGPISQGGDSGSLLVAGDSQRAVGLLFGGSNQSTIFNPIQAVLDCLEVDI
ncbi:MAG: hypothetical protein JSV42_16705 [Chloroflexota bacterium]|nr:MAG: hypothetical protein JSV42_16705 [Chloroflexota bacterium]